LQDQLHAVVASQMGFSEARNVWTLAEAPIDMVKLYIAGGDQGPQEGHTTWKFTLHDIAHNSWNLTILHRLADHLYARQQDPRWCRVERGVSVRAPFISVDGCRRLFWNWWKRIRSLWRKKLPGRIEDTISGEDRQETTHEVYGRLAQDITSRAVRERRAKRRGDVSDLYLSTITSALNLYVAACTTYTHLRR
jgi:hypothetical protein